MLIAFLILAGLLFASAVLHLTTKLFRVQNASYAKALKVVIINAVVGGFLAALVAIAAGGFETNASVVLAVLISLVQIAVFVYAARYFYRISIAQGIGIYFAQLVISFIIGIIIALLIRSFIAEPFNVAGKAMEPNLHDGTLVVLKKFNNTYNRGDIVVFKYPKDQTQFFIKRIVGLPGETVEIKNAQVYINGSALSESYLAKDTETYGAAETVTLKSDEYYVLGDNRTESSDSRVWGPVPSKLITGKYWKAIVTD